jgi:sterol desaturase/sphingolipid hydroxylase (fatty acid hydroxylase superfamily)
MMLSPETGWRSRRLLLAAAWIALLAIGTGAVLSEPLAGAIADGAKLALLELLRQGHGDAWGLATLILYFGIMIGTPLLVLGGVVLVERWTAGADSAPVDRLAWLVQALFGATTIGTLMILGQLGIRGDPLIDIRYGRDEPAYWIATIFAFLAALIAADILTYWLHRAQHRFAWLWKFHMVHHSQRVDALHNINHPIELMMSYLLVAIPVGLLIRVGPLDLLLLAGFFSIQGLLNHMRSPINLGPLGRLLSDNRFHMIHHSRDPADYGSNFAARFPFIDRMFGTYCEPRAQLPETGLPDRDPPTTVGQYVLASWSAAGDSSTIAGPSAPAGLRSA